MSPPLDASVLISRSTWACASALSSLYLFGLVSVLFVMSLYNHTALRMSTDFENKKDRPFGRSLVWIWVFSLPASHS
jgi:hypothetical protein